MKIAIGSDHAGFELKQYLFQKLKARDYDITDCGTDSNVSVDYADYTRKVCGMIRANEVLFGILICGTGIGVSMSANKIHGIRAALCHTEFSARMARQHNNANVLTLGGRVIGKELALAITQEFLADTFSDEEHHRRRIDKMMKLEESD